MNAPGASSLTPVECTYTAVDLQAVYQFLDAFENNANFGQKMFAFTNLGAKLIQTSLSHSTIVLSILIGRSRFTFLPHYMYGAL